MCFVKFKWQCLVDSVELRLQITHDIEDLLHCDLISCDSLFVESSLLLDEFLRIDFLSYFVKGTEFLLCDSFIFFFLEFFVDLDVP